MTRSTTYRYVNTLHTLGYLEQDRVTKRYRLGIKVADLGAAAINSMGLVEVARPYLRELWESTGHSVDLAVLNEGEVVYVDMIKDPRGVVLDMPVGSRLPAHCTAPGKLLLANLPEQRLEQVLAGRDLAPLGPNTITDRSQLLAELQKIRETGVAFNDEETAPGLRSIAAPVRSSSGEVLAGVNLAFYSWMPSFDNPLPEYGPAVRATADRISAKLGFQPSPDSKPVAESTRSD